MGWRYRAAWGSYPPYRLWGGDIGLRGSPGTSYRIWGGDIGLRGAQSLSYRLWGGDIGLCGAHIGYGVGI